MLQQGPSEGPSSETFPGRTFLDQIISDYRCALAALPPVRRPNLRSDPYRISVTVDLRQQDSRQIFLAEVAIVRSAERGALSVGQLARRWGVGAERIRRLVESGMLPGSFKVPSAGRYGEAVRILCPECVPITNPT